MLQPGWALHPPIPREQPLRSQGRVLTTCMGLSTGGGCRDGVGSGAQTHGGGHAGTLTLSRPFPQCGARFPAAGGPLPACAEPYGGGHGPRLPGGSGGCHGATMPGAGAGAEATREDGPQETAAEMLLVPVSGHGPAPSPEPQAPSPEPCPVPRLQRRQGLVAPAFLFLTLGSEE